MRAKNPKKSRPRTLLNRDIMEQLIFGSGRVRRFTQDSPVLPDVWLEYASGSDGAGRLTGPTDSHDPFPPIKLLLTPFRDAAAGEVRNEVRARLERERQAKMWRAF